MIRTKPTIKSKIKIPRMKVTPKFSMMSPEPRLSSPSSSYPEVSFIPSITFKFLPICSSSKYSPLKARLVYSKRIVIRSEYLIYHIPIYTRNWVELIKIHIELMDLLRIRHMMICQIDDANPMVAAYFAIASISSYSA